MRSTATGSGSDGTRRASLVVPGGASGIGGAIRWFERVLEGEGVPGEIRADLLVVFDEVVSNVALHGLRESEETIEIEVETGGDAVTLTVRDEGPAFDPLAHPPPDLDRPLAERQVGGLGIHLVRNLCDTVRYERRGESNILVVTRTLR